MSLYNDGEPDTFEALVYTIIGRTANATKSLAVESDDTVIIVVAVVSVVTVVGTVICCFFRLMKLV